MKRGMGLYLLKEKVGVWRRVEGAGYVPRKLLSKTSPRDKILLEKLVELQFL